NPTSAASPPSSPSPTSPASSTSPASPAAALAALAARERKAVTAIEAELAAVDGPLARLLASVAACRSVHVILLGLLADQSRRRQSS
ncbi:MAG TPA: hypothetical protein VHO27_08970, partial [Angustibacter sp.]|nr:hypothetical protein [Angustibacter sp.]